MDVRMMGFEVFERARLEVISHIWSANLKEAKQHY